MINKCSQVSESKHISLLILSAFRSVKAQLTLNTSQKLANLVVDYGWWLDCYILNKVDRLVGG